MTRRYANLGNTTLTLPGKCPKMEFFLFRIFLYSVRIQENMDQKELHLWTLFTQCKTIIAIPVMLVRLSIDRVFLFCLFVCFYANLELRKELSSVLFLRYSFFLYFESFHQHRKLSAPRRVVSLRVRVCF